MSDSLQIIVKVAERCNLDCAYCYMYHGADQTWRQRPAFLSAESQRHLTQRCADYLAADPYHHVTLEFHGGEPLLLGKETFAAYLAELRAALGTERASFCLQTNGTLLDDEWCDLFDTYGVTWSLSSDGPPEDHDRYRVFHDGRPSSHLVERAMRLSIDHPSPLFAGVLSVIDPAADAARLVRYFYDLGIRDLDLLLPDANYTSPPAHLARYSDEALLGYLVAAFDEWLAIGDPDFRIRLFAEMMRGLFGARSGLDAFGGQLWGMMVIESDGTYQLLDVLRIGGADQVTTGLTLAEHTMADYLARTKDIFPEPSATCRACRHFTACGGGYLPHRFDGHDYDRPSIHCAAIYGLLDHIQAYLHRVTPPELWQPVA
jgi:uncharacterized protein